MPPPPSCLGKLAASWSLSFPTCGSEKLLVSWLLDNCRFQEYHAVGPNSLESPYILEEVSKMSPG